MMAATSLNFTVSLKVGGDNIRLLIAVQDSTDEVFERLSQAYPNCNNKKTQILEKLMASLRSQLENRTLNQNLLNSIQQFLERNDGRINDQQAKPNAKKNAEKTFKNNEMNQTHQEDKENQKAVFKKRLSCNSQKHQDSRLPAKKCSVPAKPKIFTPSKPSNKVKQVGNSIERAKKCNPDVIKACELIMKKTQNTQMKLMAKEFLKEKGYLKEQKEKSLSQNKKKYTADDQQEENDKVQLPLEKAGNQKGQQNEEAKCQTSGILTNITSMNVPRQNNRFGKYKYLESSLLNESLSKDYQSFSKHTQSSILRSSEVRSKKYSYLE